MEIRLNPDGYKQVYEQYDVGRGYGPQLAAARRNFGRADDNIETELNQSGVIKKSVFSASECDEINARFEAGLCDNFDRAFTVKLLDRIFSTDVDRDIISYFGSEYVPIGADFYEADPSDDLTESDGWHCDEGPSKHLIIGAYFTDSEADGAKTLFIDRQTTDDLKAVGYVYCEMRHRIINIEDLTDALGMERPKINSLPIKAGDIVIFDAPNILHRRSMPKRAPRHVMFVAIIPSFLSWREVVKYGEFPLSLEGFTYPPLPGYAQEERSS